MGRGVLEVMAIGGNPMPHLTTNYPGPNYPIPSVQMGSLGNTYYSVAGDSPKKDWTSRIRPTSPYMAAMRGIYSSGEAEEYGHLDKVKPYLMSTRGLRGGLPTPIARVLLMGVKGKIMERGIIGSLATASLLRSLKLVHYIPCVPGKRRGYHKTSSNGVELLQYWRDTDSRFTPFYDAYVGKADEMRVRAWATSLAMGMEIDIIEQAEKDAKEAQAKIDAAALAHKMNYNTINQQALNPQMNAQSYYPWASSNNMLGLQNVNLSTSAVQPVNNPQRSPGLLSKIFGGGV
jgi:hypothetical protein